MKRCEKIMEKVPIRRTMVKTKNSKDEVVRSLSPTTGESPTGEVSYKTSLGTSRSSCRR